MSYLLISLLGDDLHARRVESLENGVRRAIKSAQLGIHAIGRGLAAAGGLGQKHAVKQVDRYIRNEGIQEDALSPALIRASAFVPPRRNTIPFA